VLALPAFQFKGRESVHRDLSILPEEKRRIELAKRYTNDGSFIQNPAQLLQIVLTL